MKNLLAAVTVLAVSTAQADTIYVDASCPGGDGSELDPYCSIQTAIDNAVDTDEIVVAPGTYFETINFDGKAVWLHSSGGAEVTTIDAQETGSVVTCDTGEGPETVLKGFTITGGTGTESVGAIRGGGMFNFESHPTVTNCTFVRNTAHRGGGMSNCASSPTVTSCTFIGNSATSNNGGGMNNHCVSHPTVTNCTFSGNTAAGEGGAVRSNSDITWSNCIMWGNTPDEIGGSQGTYVLTYSDVQGGWPGIGNIDADPLFVDPDAGDYRLSPGSPCIDAGDNDAVPVDITTDLDGNPRFVDDLGTIDTGNGDPPIVDMGAYEFQGTSCPWDCEPTPNGDVGINDFLAVLAQWGTPGSCDFDGGGVGINDFLGVLAAWGPCP